MVSDTVKVFAHQTTFPYAKVDSVKIKLDSLGYGSGKFTKTAAGSHYISVTHRNSIETWSKFPLTFTTAGVTYNLTTTSSQAYGDNMKLKNGKWCIYNGDANQDGVVDLIDMIKVDNDSYNFVIGYVTTDLNGDNTIDLYDMIIVDNNSYNFVGVIRP